MWTTLGDEGCLKAIEALTRRVVRFAGCDDPYLQDSTQSDLAYGLLRWSMLRRPASLFGNLDKDFSNSYNVRTTKNSLFYADSIDCSSEYKACRKFSTLETPAPRSRKGVGCAAH